MLMRLIDELFLKRPFYGVPRMTDWLRTLGHAVNHKRVARLMRLMNLQAVVPGRTPASRIPHTRYTRICCGIWWWTGPTTCGAPILRMCRCGAASCIWWLCWTGTVGTCWPGRCRTRWRRGSAWRPWTRRWRAASPRSSTPIKARNLPARPSRGDWPRPRSRSAWMGVAGPGQRLCGAALAECEVRGGLSAGLRRWSGSLAGVAALLCVL